MKFRRVKGRIFLYSLFFILVSLFFPEAKFEKWVQAIAGFNT